jgi:hypothetical protein
VGAVWNFAVIQVMNLGSERRTRKQQRECVCVCCGFCVVCVVWGGLGWVSVFAVVKSKCCIPPEKLNQVKGRKVLGRGHMDEMSVIAREMSCCINNRQSMKS